MHKKISFLGIFLFMMSGIVFSQSDAIVGLWFNEEKDGKVEIYKNGDKYFGKIVWLKEPFEDDGKSQKKDSKNKTTSLRNRNILNMVMLTNFTYDGSEWKGGEVYDPKNGETYSAKMKLNGKVLELRGYIGIPMFGRTTKWTRP